MTDNTDTNVVLFLSIIALIGIGGLLLASMRMKKSHEQNEEEDPEDWLSGDNEDEDEDDLWPEPEDEDEDEEETPPTKPKKFVEVQMCSECGSPTTTGRCPRGHATFRLMPIGTREVDE